MIHERSTVWSHLDWGSDVDTRISRRRHERRWPRLSPVYDDKCVERGIALTALDARLDRGSTLRADFNRIRERAKECPVVQVGYKNLYPTTSGIAATESRGRPSVGWGEDRRAERHHREQAGRRLHRRVPVLRTITSSPGGSSGSRQTTTDD